MTSSPDRTAREPSNMLTADQAVEWCEHPIDFARDKMMVAAFFAKMRVSVPVIVRDARTRIAELEAENARLAGERNSILCEMSAQARARGEAEAKLRAAWEAGRGACADAAKSFGDMWRKDAVETSDPSERRWNMMHGAERIEKHIRRLQPPAEYAGEVAR